MLMPWLTALTILNVVHGTIVPQFSQQGRLVGSSFGHSGVNATYDYVIVGAGTAGAVVALRLLEAGVGSVALIEAGSFPQMTNGNWSQIPYYNTKYSDGDTSNWQPFVDWGLNTVPQRNGKVIHYALGKGLGGSSMRNQMLYHRPTIGSYQRWAQMVGDQSYTWSNMLPFLQRSVEFTPPNSNARASNATVAYDAGAYTRNGGPLKVSYSPYAQPISSYGAAAFSAIGIDPTDSFVSGTLNGSAYWPYSIDSATGTRSSSESSFLTQAFSNPNLTVYINTQAMNVVFNGNKTATAINATVDGIQPFFISARREVILSAGAYYSPQLLMVSGIGPAATLQQYQIPVIAALKGVGQNMWDTHAIGSSAYKSRVTGQMAWEQGSALWQATSEFLRNGTGPLTNIGTDYAAFEKLPRQNLSDAAKAHLDSFPSDWPDIEYDLSGTSMALSSSGTPTSVAVGALLLSPFKRGNMTIASASMKVPPVIDPNWLRSDIDMELAVAAFKRARLVAQALNVTIGQETSPGPNVTSDAQIRDWIHKNVVTIHHASASCAMGRPNDTMAVVDSHARVYGVQKLRVIDAASFPFTPPGHCQAAVYAHAEKLVNDMLTGN